MNRPGNYYHMNNIQSFNGNTSFDRILTPKTKYNFNNDNNYYNINNRRPSRVNSYNSRNTSGEHNSNSKNRSNFKTMKNAVNLSRERENKSFENSRRNSKNYCETSVSNYLQRRHNESQQKIMKIKNEKIINEIKELRDRPNISAKSRKIVENSHHINANVFDRLTNKSQSRKKQLEIKKLEEMNNKNTEKPKINEYSNNIQRSINDLLYWKQNLQEKRENQIYEITTNMVNNPKILKASEDILREKNPEYLGTKVEERLLQQGRLSKHKIEGKKDFYNENFVSYNNNSSATTVNNSNNCNNKNNSFHNSNSKINNQYIYNNNPADYPNNNTQQMKSNNYSENFGNEYEQENLIPEIGKNLRGPNYNGINPKVQNEVNSSNGNKQLNLSHENNQHLNEKFANNISSTIQSNKPINPHTQPNQNNPYNLKSKILINHKDENFGLYFSANNKGNTIYLPNSGIENNSEKDNSNNNNNNINNIKSNDKYSSKLIATDKFGHLNTVDQLINENNTNNNTLTSNPDLSNQLNNNNFNNINERNMAVPQTTKNKHVADNMLKNAFVANAENYNNSISKKFLTNNSNINKDNKNININPSNFYFSEYNNNYNNNNDKKNPQGSLHINTSISSINGSNNPKNIMTNNFEYNNNNNNIPNTVKNSTSQNKILTNKNNYNNDISNRNKNQLANKNNNYSNRGFSAQKENVNIRSNLYSSKSLKTSQNDKSSERDTNKSKNQKPVKNNSSNQNFTYNIINDLANNKTSNVSKSSVGINQKEENKKQNFKTINTSNTPNVSIHPVALENSLALPSEQIVDIRRHLNNYYSSKQNENKNKIFKEFMTTQENSASKNIPKDQSRIDYKNSIKHFLGENPVTYNEENNYTQNQNPYSSHYNNNNNDLYVHIEAENEKYEKSHNINLNYKFLNLNAVENNANETTTKFNYRDFKEKVLQDYQKSKNINSEIKTSAIRNNNYSNNNNPVTNNIINNLPLQLDDNKKNDIINDMAYDQAQMENFNSFTEGYNTNHTNIINRDTNNNSSYTKFNYYNYYQQNKNNNINNNQNTNSNKQNPNNNINIIDHKNARQTANEKNKYISNILNENNNNSNNNSYSKGNRNSSVNKPAGYNNNNNTYENNKSNSDNINKLQKQNAGYETSWGNNRDSMYRNTNSFEKTEEKSKITTERKVENSIHSSFRKSQRLEDENTEITTSNAREKDLNSMMNFMRSLNINEPNNSQKNENNVNNHILKNKFSYENEIKNIHNNIEFINERLKLNEINKNSIMTNYGGKKFN